MTTAGLGEFDRRTLVSLYYGMLRIRVVEERLAEIYSEQEIRCPTHLCTGQEATPVGVCAHLSRTDLVFSNHRSHGHYLAKGGDLKAMVAELYGRATGCARGRGGSMHLIDAGAGFLGSVPIVSSTIPIAVGAAWGSRLRGEDRVVVSFFGDAAVEEGNFHEAANFAVLRRLPVVFVCENNLYSVYSPLSVRQPEGLEIFQMARGHGMTSLQGNGNDVVEVYKLAGTAIDSARRGQGPVFLEFKTYRWREHCGPNYDYDLGYRTEDEFQEWKERCPVKTFQQRLLEVGALTEGDIDRMTKELDREMDEAIAFAKDSPFPGPDELFDHTYAT